MKRTPLSIAICLVLMPLFIETTHAKTIKTNSIKPKFDIHNDLIGKEKEEKSEKLLAIQTTLSPIVVTANTNNALSSLAFDNAQKASDIIVNSDKLRQRSATLGNALADELGVHSNPFGGGASAPVVRGQEGVRIKVLQNGMDSIDMSALSPDHVIGVDTLFADRIELIRGPSTLLYSTASPAGVINIVDQRIPTEIPKGGYTGEAMLRFNENNDEKVALAGVTFGLTDNVAFHVEGMTRKANNYEVPEIKLGESLNYLPDSHNSSNVGTVGLSYISDIGHIGFAYGERSDKYGLVGHNHKFDGCGGHVINQYGTGRNRPYLSIYPHLMGDEDLVDSFHFHCASDYDLDPKHSHEHPFGHDHDHTQNGPWVNMKSKNYYLQGEIYPPISTIEKVRLEATYNDYHHEEHDHGKIIPDPAKGTVFVKANPSYFDNQGYNIKLKAYHNPTKNLQGVWGIQTQSHKSSALIPSKQERSENRYPLVENKNLQFSLFGVEQYKLNNWLFEAGLRYEKSRIPIVYDLDKINNLNKSYNSFSTPEYPDLTPYKDSAFSYALGSIWDITPQYRLDISYSHNERIPTPMELYYHGKNLATNSFLYGNKNLNKEKSENLELGIQFDSDNWNYKASIYGNHFNNYIHAENLHRTGNLYIRRMTQSKAKIHGLEAEASYKFLPGHSATIFGDYVNGKLYGFKPIYGNNIYAETSTIKYLPEEECGASIGDAKYEEWCGYKENELIGRDKVNRPKRNAPRMSPLRLGFRLKNEYNDNWSTSLDFTRVFTQKKTSTAIIAEIPRDKTLLEAKKIPEDSTSGYSLLNLGIDYKNKLEKSNNSLEYTLSLHANNLLNEEIYVHNSFLPFVPQMGRNISMSLNFKF